MDKHLKIVSTLALVLIAISVSYYFLYFLPEKEAYYREQRVLADNTKKCQGKWDEQWTPEFSERTTVPSEFEILLLKKKGFLKGDLLVPEDEWIASCLEDLDNKI